MKNALSLSKSERMELADNISAHTTKRVEEFLATHTNVRGESKLARGAGPATKMPLLSYEVRVAK